MAVDDIVMATGMAIIADRHINGYVDLQDIFDKYDVKMNNKWLDFERKLGIIFECKQALIWESFLELECITVMDFINSLLQRGEITPYEFMELYTFSRKIKARVILFDYN